MFQRAFIYLNNIYYLNGCRGVVSLLMWRPVPGHGSGRPVHGVSHGGGDGLVFIMGRSDAIQWNVIENDGMQCDLMYFLYNLH